MPSEPLSRRAFLRLAQWPLAAVALSACRMMAADERSPSLPPVEGDKVGFVHDNHMHDAVLPKGDIDAGQLVSIHIQGRSQHDHAVKLSAADIADIRAGREVWVRSSTDWGHFHEVVFNRNKAG